ncbi:MAG TPA: ATP-NAD kinase, partial [Clostridiales bacterium UBA9857]|nr:ATP-NAD kinase [Clostridiales bacterium UBA9857]
DGTARNIYNAVGDKVPVLGIPAGVKIHSSVFATSPKDAGQLAARFLTGEVQVIKDAEVMDLDEHAFREGRVTARLYGYVRVPYEEQLVQNLKSGSTESELAALDGIADRIIEDMEPDVAYIIGPGTTTRPIMEKLGLEATLLGVDVVLNKQLLVADANEEQLLRILHGEDGVKGAKIIVTIIGGQGYVFGRGNQQLSPEVIRKVGKDNIRIVATRAKLNALNRRPLLVDTGDDELNQMLKGYYHILVSYDREVMYKIG